MKGQGDWQICLHCNKVSLRFFSIHFIIIGVAKIVHYTEDSRHKGS